MDGHMSIPRNTYSPEYYHIRWLPSSKLDWESFETPKEAEDSAKSFVGANETYVVEVAAGECERCREVVERTKNLLAPEKSHHR